MKSATIHLETIACPSCIQKITNGVLALEGVDKDSVNVMFNSSKVKLNFDETLIDIEDIEDSITSLGYIVKKSRVK